MKRLVIFFALIFLFSSGFSQTDTTKEQKTILKPELKFKFKFFIKYKYTSYLQNNQTKNEFEIYRAYFTTEAKLTKNLSLKLTADAKKSNYEYNIFAKYALAKLSLGSLAFFVDNYVETGIIPRTWIEYEESFNPYRVLNPMFIEQAGIINSADVGIALKGLLGEKAYHNKWGGKFGSYAIGIYNGGGYNHAEVNNNKLIDARLSLKPLFFVKPLKKFEISGSFVYGQPNMVRKVEPFRFYNFMALYSNKFLRISAQYFVSYGDYLGNKYVLDKALKTKGIAGFTELRSENWAFFTKVGFINGELNRVESGLSRYFKKDIKAVVAYFYYPDLANVFQIALDLRF